MSKWIVFSLLWIVGLFVADRLAGSSLGGTGSRLFFFGGMWMIWCLAAKDAIAGYQEAKARRKTPNFIFGTGDAEPLKHVQGRRFRVVDMDNSQAEQPARAKDER